MKNVPLLGSVLALATLTAGCWSTQAVPPFTLKVTDERDQVVPGVTARWHGHAAWRRKELKGTFQAGADGVIESSPVVVQVSILDWMWDHFEALAPHSGGCTTTTFSFIDIDAPKGFAFAYDTSALSTTRPSDGLVSPGWQYCPDGSSTLHDPSQRPATRSWIRVERPTDPSKRIFRVILRPME